MDDMQWPEGLTELVQQGSIDAGPLPDQQNYVLLKQKAIRRLKLLAGQVWSNFNESDPGVTILEQICYAMTELGYVNGFDIEDVLTGPDGKITYQDQFFEPQNILTSAPVTLRDYRLLVMTQFPEVDGVYIEPLQVKQALTGLYSVSFYGRSIPPELEQDCALRIQNFLNTQRNLGEFFLTPQALEPLSLALVGKVLLTSEANSDYTYECIKQTLREYVCPLLQLFGYDQLVANQVSTDAIFNGPKLKGGWSDSEQPLAEKRSSVSLTELVSLISAVPGVAAVEGLRFESSSALDIQIDASHIADVYLSHGFTLTKNQTAVAGLAQDENELVQLRARLNSRSVDAHVDLAPDLPTGEFRDIASYYSVQNTFPDIYAVGANALHSDAPDYRVAQSRQLMGYLMLFDQVLANQFSQLANLSNLFSFSFERTLVTPSATPRKTAKQVLASSIPSRPLARTYFYQPLYQVPGAFSLLKGVKNNQYFYPDDPTDASARDALIWTRYKNDAFNPYHYGLSQAVESTQEAEQRRDDMLSHLLARHGEPADAYNDLFDSCWWLGGKLKTRILLKTVWLQNLQALSYYRLQACRYDAASYLPNAGQLQLAAHSMEALKKRYPELDHTLHRLQNQLFSSRQDAFKQLVMGYLNEQRDTLKNQDPEQRKTIQNQVIQRCKQVVRGMEFEDINHLLSDHRYMDFYHLLIDGEFDLAALEQFAKIPDKDYDNFSVYEIKCSILLGFERYVGLLARDLVALVSDAKFLAWLESTSDQQSFSLDSECVTDRADIHATWSEGQLLVSVGAQQVLNLSFNQDGEEDKATQIQTYINQLYWLSKMRKGFILVEHTLLQAKPSADPSQADDATWYSLAASMVFPSYVTLTHTPNFQYFLELIKQLHWPMHIQQSIKGADVGQMGTLIQQYCQWFNQQAADNQLSTNAAQSNAIQFKLKQTLQQLPPLKRLQSTTPPTTIGGAA